MISPEEQQQQSYGSYQQPMIPQQQQSYGQVETTTQMPFIPQQQQQFLIGVQTPQCVCSVYILKCLPGNPMIACLGSGLRFRLKYSGIISISFDTSLRKMLLWDQ